MKRIGICLTLILLMGHMSVRAQVDETEDLNVAETEVRDTLIYDYQSLQDIARYIGGDDSLNRFVRTQLKAQKALNYTSKMRFSIVVNQDSTIESILLITTTRDLDPYAKSAVIQSLKFTSGQWIPGIRNGEYVRSRRIVEINITW